MFRLIETKASGECRAKSTRTTMMLINVHLISTHVTNHYLSIQHALDADSTDFGDVCPVKYPQRTCDLFIYEAQASMSRLGVARDNRIRRGARVSQTPPTRNARENLARRRGERRRKRESVHIRYSRVRLTGEIRVTQVTRG